MCNFRQSSFRYCTFSAFNRYAAQFIDSIIRILDEVQINPAPIFFDHCYFRNPIMVLNCQIYTSTIVPSVTSVEDLKKILWINIGYDKYLEGPYLSEFINVGPIGSRNSYTTYIPVINWVQCGCWKADKDSKEYGGSLEAFEQRVKNEYPEGLYHDEYMAAIQLFKVYRERYKDKEEITNENY